MKSRCVFLIPGSFNKGSLCNKETKLNKIALIVPCHRVIGTNGKLTGYAGGLALKAKLLMHEGAHFKI